MLNSSKFASFLVQSSTHLSYVLPIQTHQSRLNKGPQGHEILIPGTCKDYLIWEKDLYRCD